MTTDQQLSLDDPFTAQHGGSFDCDVRPAATQVAPHEAPAQRVDGPDHRLDGRADGVIRHGALAEHIRRHQVERLGGDD